MENSVIPENGCGRSSGIWTSSQSLRKTSISSTQTLPGGLWYVVGVIFKMLRNSAENVFPVARVSVTQSAITPFNLLYVFKLSSKRLNNTEGPKSLQSKAESVQILLLSFMKPPFHVSIKEGGVESQRGIIRSKSCTPININICPSFLSLCDGCDQQTELDRTNPNPGSRLASCTQWQRYGWNCSDWLWQNTFGKLWFLVPLF